MDEQRLPIPGSKTIQGSGGSWFPADPDQLIRPSIVIRRPKRAGDLSEELLSGSFHQRSREEAEQLLRADAADLAAVRTFAQGYGLTVISEDADTRTVKVEGTLAQVAQAFGVQIDWRVDTEGRKYLSYRGTITLPSALAEIVEAVLGLDQRPVARARAAE